MDPKVAQQIFAQSSYAAQPQVQQPGRDPFSGGAGFNRGSVSGLAALDMIMGTGPQRKVTPFGQQISGVGGGGFTGSPEMMVNNAAGGGPAKLSAPSQSLIQNMQRTQYQAPQQRQAPQTQQRAMQPQAPRPVVPATSRTQQRALTATRPGGA